MSEHLASEPSFLDCWLMSWILAAMAVGVAPGHLAFCVAGLWNRVQVDTTKIPIAVGRVVVVYPPLARMRYEELGEILRNWKVLALSLVQSRLIGPILVACDVPRRYLGPGVRAAEAA